jgi:Uma2 family endonuclease
LSPSSIDKDTKVKKILYERAGVKEYIILSQDGYITCFVHNGVCYNDEYISNVYKNPIFKSSVIKGLEINLKDIFELE